MTGQGTIRVLVLFLPVALAACVPPVSSSNGGVPVVVGGEEGMAFGFSDGAAARRAADAACGPRGVRSSIYDRFDRAAGIWVFPSGCA